MFSSITMAPPKPPQTVPATDDQVFMRLSLWRTFLIQVTIVIARNVCRVCKQGLTGLSACSVPREAYWQRKISGQSALGKFPPALLCFQLVSHFLCFLHCSVSQAVKRSHGFKSSLFFSVLEHDYKSGTSLGMRAQKMGIAEAQT